MSLAEDEPVFVAQIGKTVGLKGDLKLHNKSDFPSQYKKGATFFLDDGAELTISSYNKTKSIVRFDGYEDISLASGLVNRSLFSTVEKTKNSFELNEDEFFWFDIIGLKVVEDGETLGVVESIEDIASNSYFVVSTDKNLQNDGYPKSFLIPYIDRYVIKCDVENGSIITDGAFDILKSS